MIIISCKCVVTRMVINNDFPEMIYDTHDMTNAGSIYKYNKRVH